ncbi:Tetratricopeptide-like helical domain superfamily [Sesbania bispinosa]|nr:Tetratricopeptide-like helical domain superfamily [Sesbania bispinosa]
MLSPLLEFNYRYLQNVHQGYVTETLIRKKGGGSSKAPVENSANNGSVELDSSASLKRAHELKEEGNGRFQNKDYASALQQYDNALRLTPKNHPDRAVFHSNKAACLMQMKPIDHESVIAECTMALQVQPQFVRALLRRARAYESVGNNEMALRDVKALLAAEPTHSDALEIAHRLRTALEPRPSPAALGVSAVRARKEEVEIRSRPLKLVYDHDIRLAQMPMNCSFRALRDTVRKKFPSSNSVLIKYKDNDGDLVTITSTDELRMAESSVDTLSDSIGMLRLNIVEVNSEQEPPILEEQEQKPVESGSISNDIDTKVVKVEKDTTKEDTESKEIEMDDWMFEFAQFFRSRVGIDGDAHVDLHELGVEFCSEALEELVTGEEAQGLFDKAALKFQEVAALAFFNWGNVHMCAARKRVPLEGKEKEVVAEGLQVAFDWVKEKYCLAREKYEQALLIKPDFHEGLLALGQQQFELAKLHWSFVLAKKIDLSGWDSRETLQLFDSAEQKMKGATEMWEKLEEQKVNELKDPKKEELLRRKKKQGDESSGVGGQDDGVSAEEAAQHAAVMRSQIHLFWGNLLFERSQVECKLGMADWKKNLDAAIVHFKLAGASEADVSMVLKNHCSNGEVKGSRTHNTITLVE